MADRDPAARRPEVAARQAATSGPSRHQVMAGALSGESGRAMARRLGMTHKTVQMHLGRLLADRVLAKAGDRYVPGAAHQLEVAKIAGGGLDRYPPGPATAGGAGLMTDGKRTFTVLSPPKLHPADMPGFVKTSLSGRGRVEVKRRNHEFRWNEAGRTHAMVMTFQPTTDGWGLQYLRCLPPPRKADLGEADKETVWDRFTSHAVVAFANLATFTVDPTPRRSRAVSLAYPGVAPAGMKVRRADLDMDDTPSEQTLEVRTDALAAAIERLPEWEVAVINNLSETERRVGNVESSTERLVRLVSRMVANQEGLLASQSGLARLLVPPSFPSTPSSGSGVEFQ